MKDIKYIIKRIIIGVGIALTLAFLRGNLLIGVSAKEITPVWQPFSNNIVVVTNLDESVTFSSGGGSWANWGFGIMRFNFSVTKVAGSSVAPTLSINNVAINNYTCNVSSTSTGNSTFTSSTYSAECPMNMGAQGLTGLYIGLTGNQQNEQASYRIVLGGLFTFEKVDDFNVDFSSTNNTINNQTNSINQNQNQNTQNIINNQNQNKQDVINNQNQNTQSVINNQNQNTEKEIESQKTCIESTSFNFKENYNLNNYGREVVSSGMGTTDYISLNGIISMKTLSTTTSTPSRLICFYTDKSYTNLISCENTNLLESNVEISIPNNAKYFRMSKRLSNNIPTINICYNGNQAISNQQQQIQNTLNDDSVDTNQASTFFDDFSVDNHGLSGIISAPLRLLESLSTASCDSLVIPLPFVSQNAILPCMSTIYSKFPTFLNLWQLITTGMIAYYICINLFGSVRKLQRPDDDRIEVFNL